ncbi:hypothetical protein L1987_82687 [Smallanthus sonchifolius]|uniref:Uncharacterized protein n=1 Tax=Smallanthus sonchifolius TaxID=185202 RepID=A0ACB8YBU8_9ASTR|nr:hypothetical protein L1987_82687 [Smallanthus sonchifolius]
MLCEGVIEFGPYWDHVLGVLNAALESPDKILFFKYEEIKRDLEGHMKKLAEFMGVSISVQEEESGMVKKIAEFCSFENLKSLEINKTGDHRADNGIVVPNQAFFSKRRSQRLEVSLDRGDERPDRSNHQRQV